MSKVFVITGATSGIGRATALSIAEENANLVLVGRNKKRGAKIVRCLLRRVPNFRPQFIETDLSRQGEVRRLARRIREEFDHVDTLINNAGARFDRYGVTEDDIERTFATNHLGHFLLTCLLLPSMALARSARVITVTSRAHFAAQADGCWLYRQDNYDRRQAYAKSKLANLLFAFELARRLERTNIVSTAVDPGVVTTRFALNNGPIAWARHIISHWVKGTLTSSKVAAESIVHLATFEKPGALAGNLFRNGQVIKASEAARSPALAEDLWNQSARMVGESLDLASFTAGPRSLKMSYHPKPAASLCVHD
jgi:NAD(P)-dependent dehydrogenase (short-subunit alcohol dehydrogenase family)